MAPRKTKVTDAVYEVWFPKNVKNIFIVVKRDSNPPEDAYAFSKEYKYLDRMGDKDLILYTYVFLSRYYPNANIEICISEDFIKRADYEKNNLVILGGPSSNHEVCQQFMATSVISKHLRYPPNEVRKVELCGKCLHIKDFCPRESICIDNELFYYQSGSVIVDRIEAEKAKIPENRVNSLGNGKVQVLDCVMVDKSIFASIINPFSQDKKVILISGIHCMGGVGAFRAFDTVSQQSIDNYRYYKEKIAGAKEFIAVFDVEINPRSGTPIACPRLKENILFNLDDEKSVIIGTEFKVDDKEELEFDLYADREECLAMQREMRVYEYDENIPDFSSKVKQFVSATTRWVSKIQVYYGKIISADSAKSLHHEFEGLRSQYQALKGISGI